MKDEKDIEIVSGDGSNLEISPVYDHINAGTPKSTNKPKNIVVPKELKDKDKKEKDKNNTEKDKK